MRKNSFAEVVRHLCKLSRPLHDKDLRAIRRQDVVNLLDRIAQKNGPVTADRVCASLAPLFGWALDRGKIEVHPAIRIKPYSGQPQSYRPLAEPELAQVWHASGTDTYGAVVRFGILTALRRANILELTWDEVDLDKAELRIPGSKMKNNERFGLPLSTQAMAVLEAQPRKGPMVFDRLGHKHQLKKDLDSRINAKRTTPITPWVFHSFRSTFASLSSDHDLAPPHILDECLAHKGSHKAGVAGIYNKSRYETQKREAMNRWGAFVLELVRAGQ
jgi:integrase